MGDHDVPKFEPVRNGKAATNVLTSVPSSFLDSKLLEYRKLIQNADSTLLNILAKGLREQNPAEAEHGLVAILEWQNGAYMGKTVVESSALLREHLDKEPREVAGRCRLFIVQDLPRNHVEVLGSRLKIHPTIFARHWSDSSFLETLDDIVDPSKDWSRFTVPYPEFIKAVQFLEQPQWTPEELYRADFLVRRLMAIPKIFGEWDLRSSIAEIEACVSFWGRKHVKGGGWDALVMVDPPVGQKILFINHIAAPHVTGIIEPRREVPIVEGRELVQMFAQHDSLPDDEKEWWSVEKSRPPKSMFHQLIDVFETKQMPLNSNPLRACGRPLRDLALRKWEVFLNHAMHCLILTKGEPYYNNGHFNSAISALWDTGQEEWLLARLVKWSRRLGTERVTVSTVLRNCGVRFDAQRRHDLSAEEEVRGSRIMDPAEVDRWCWVYDKLGEYKDLYDTTSTSYIQVLQLRESQIANKQARSIGRITVLGALFVPISIVSGIMSMGGEYIPGGGRFWVFFAVTGPILVMIFLVLFTNVLSWAGATLVVAQRKIVRERDQEEVTEAPISKKLSFTKSVIF